MGDDQWAFQEIYDAFQPGILRYLELLAGEQEAEDLTQETFVKASRALGSFRGDSSLSTWLYRIATNTALDKLRSPSFQRLVQQPPEGAPPEAEDRNTWTGEKAPSVEGQVYRKEMNECIREFIAGLPEDYRTVLALGEFEHLSNEEISQVLGVSLDTVKIRLHRARKRLKQELAGNCDRYWVEDNEFIPELKRPEE